MAKDEGPENAKETDRSSSEGGSGGVARTDRRGFLTALGAGALLAGAGEAARRMASGGAASGEAAVAGAAASAASPKVPAPNANYAHLTRRLAKLSRVQLPQGFDVQNLTDEDILRISDLAAQGVPMRHRAFMNGQEVIADEPCNGQHHRDGKNCTGDLFLCNGEFTCQGSIFDDFECYAGTPGMSGFVCSIQFSCLFSFDMSDCPGAPSGSGDFQCEPGPNRFTAEGCTGYAEYPGGGGGGGGPTGYLGKSPFSGVHV